METKNLAGLYDLPVMEWDAVHERLERGFEQAPGSGGPDRHTCWLTTINPDGTPHVTGVGVWYHDGAFWFTASRASRKGTNLARDPRCALALAVHEFDLVVEGRADLVTDREEVAATAARAAEGGWPARPDESGEALTAEYSAPSAGPPPWHVYRLVATSATGVGTVEPGGATRWTF
ncbi:pyridoxamine 5'-phosphate oxidase family protein [Antribacter sp. KLBMP9083]|uniref:Pyridoxamine 5'-phosphate oxidase family protein n=1 Tax=Antribacter soli TaxID=2910976 RepID=A0AA41QHZ4_9MICO|nr:pyridoxamine 5'-phosphate oxidase family protein [Antribacter soli]MCF4122487.1 pyridoxamine 5'-phosphate oxidase family protein [Antribacter soli]